MGEYGIGVVVFLIPSFSLDMLISFGFCVSIDTYFCHPYYSWEKGGMENLFGRLRRFIPKKSSLKNYTGEQIIGFAEIMNNTPRKCLNWKTPREVFEEQSVLNGLKINLNIYSKLLHLTI